jgi:hypothetical protein
VLTLTFFKLGDKCSVNLRKQEIYPMLNCHFDLGENVGHNLVHPTPLTVAHTTITSLGI